MTKEDMKQISDLMDEKFVAFEGRMDEKFIASEDRMRAEIVASVIAAPIISEGECQLLSSFACKMSDRDRRVWILK